MTTNINNPLEVLPTFSMPVRPCGLDANCASEAFRIAGDLWAHGSMYLVDCEDGTWDVCRCDVDEEEGSQQLVSLLDGEIAYNPHAALIGAGYVPTANLWE